LGLVHAWAPDGHEPTWLSPSRSHVSASDRQPSR